MSDEQRELTEYLSDKETRYFYLDSSIRHLLALQLRSMREARGWEQSEVGEKAGGMTQSTISRLEDPRYGKFTLSTLKRLAEAFDVAVIVRFTPFNEFISWVTKLNELHLSPVSFEEEQSYDYALKQLFEESQRKKDTKGNYQSHTGTPDPIELLKDSVPSTL